MVEKSYPGNRPRKISACAIVLIFTVGSALDRFYDVPLTWDEVRKFGDVTFNDAKTEGTTIHIPVTVKVTSGDSLHVLNFASSISGNNIQIKASLKLPDAPHTAGEITVPTNGRPLRESYQLVYRNPDGTQRRIGEVVLARPHSQVSL